MTRGGRPTLAALAVACDVTTPRRAMTSLSSATRAAMAAEEEEAPVPPQKRFYRQRAHSNPLADHTLH